MRYLLLAMALLCCLQVPSTALADSDQQRARRAVTSGEALPLKRILGALRGSFPGEVLDANLFERNGAWFYEIKILGPDNRVIEVVVDARSGRVLGQR